MTSVRLADDDDAVGRSDGDSTVRGDGDGGGVPAGLGRDEGGAEGPRDGVERGERNTHTSKRE